MIQAPKQSHTQKAAKPEIYRAPVFMVYFCPHTQQHAGISVRDASPFLLALPVRHGRMSIGNIMPRAESVRNALFCHKHKETYMLCAAAHGLLPAAESAGLEHAWLTVWKACMQRRAASAVRSRNQPLLFACLIWALRSNMHGSKLKNWVLSVMFI